LIYPVTYTLFPPHTTHVDIFVPHAPEQLKTVSVRFFNPLFPLRPFERSQAFAGALPPLTSSLATSIYWAALPAFIVNRPFGPLTPATRTAPKSVAPTLNGPPHRPNPPPLSPVLPTKKRPPRELHQCEPFPPPAVATPPCPFLVLAPPPLFVKSV